MNPTTATQASEPTPRRRNAADSRERLLRAAQELFAERGYERTTVREIGHRAEVDPAMIARYFGSKATLYLETLRRDQAIDDEPFDLTDVTTIQALLDRVGTRGTTPTLYAAAHPHEDTELQAAAMDVLQRRMISPSRRSAEQADRDEPQLRAEIATAALAGIVLSRTSGTLGALAAAPSADVAKLVAELISSVLRPDRVA
ncbi:TetR family transcriptional regulator [Luteimicrobium album]|uniref:TetR family transcriptional regulator n=1 Tax=Luteimicrobium album TaxID=1054550 RepID=A0ABQ6I2C6_9MICO|nr:TetR/AcrR family transcriptional regulator [Luteimicrobium album]GMA24928.1 TetR family transcriptional regulator [Luteimicrobium album]